jgi:hypothetical protein
MIMNMGVAALFPGRVGGLAAHRALLADTPASITENSLFSVISRVKASTRSATAAAKALAEGPGVTERGVRDKVGEN